MAQTHRVSGVATSVLNEDDRVEVRYHGTMVVEVTIDQIVLNTGGWKTTTTKLRMNQASNQFGLGYQVFQKDYAWYVEYKGETLGFHTDRLVLKR